MSSDGLKKLVVPMAEKTVPCVKCKRDVTVTAPIDDKGRAIHIGVICKECADQEAVPIESRMPTVEWLEQLGLNIREHGQSTFDNFDASGSPVALEASKEFVKAVTAARRYEPVRSLYLVGPTGTGKTHLLAASLRWIHENGVRSRAKFDRADRLIIRIQDSYRSGLTDQLIDSRARAPLYCLDDLGREKHTEDSLRILCMILDERVNAPTIITSNFLPHELAARYNSELWGRIESRLGDAVYRFVRVQGPDRRYRS